MLNKNKNVAIKQSTWPNQMLIDINLEIGNIFDDISII